MPDHTELCQALPRGEISLVAEDDGLFLVLRGEVDAMVVAAFLADWDSCPPPLAGLDAGWVRSLDSCGLSFLVHWAHAARLLGSPAILRQASQPVWRLIHSAGVATVFLDAAGFTPDRGRGRTDVPAPRQGRRDNGASR